MSRCTSRSAWGYFPGASPPPAGPRWYRCELERGHDGAHEGDGQRWDGLRGRPSAGLSERVTVLVTADVAAALDERAQAAGQSRTEYVRGVLERAAAG